MECRGLSVWHLVLIVCCSTASAHFLRDAKNESLSSQGTCLYNGTWFADKEELPTRGLCLVCRCFPGFVEPNAFSCSVIDCPWEDYHKRFPGCTPIYADRDCCPIGWECDYGTQNPGQQLSKGADCDCEWRYLKHYEAKGCRPVYEEKPRGEKQSCTCPWRFDCSQADDIRADDRVCLYKKHVYPVGSKIPTNNPCESCSCATDYFTQAATISCTTTECPAVYSQTPLPEGCHYVYKEDQCCPTSVECPTAKKDNIYQVPACEYKDKMYYEGEQIYPDEDPCLICLCSQNWTGINSSSCRQHDCMLERDARKLKQGCIPIYHEKTCCPIDYHCADDDFDFKSNRGASFKSDDDEDEMCFFESRYYPIGHVLDIKHPTNCVTCTCKTPPDFTCIHSSCPPPPNNDYTNCRAVYKPHSCCPDYTCEEKTSTACPDPICKGTNCWLVKQDNGCHLCRCKSRCMPCPPMCQPENPGNECSGCICQLNSTSLFDFENAKTEEQSKDEQQSDSLQQLIQECKKLQCSSDERCMLVETKCDKEPCLPVPKCEKVAFGCGQSTCPEGCEEIGSYENNCPLCYCKEQIKEHQYKLTCRVQSCEENCILTGRDTEGCPICKCPQGNLEERACANSPCTGFNCTMAVNSFGCAECRCQLSCKPKECPAGCDLDLDVPENSGLQCGCQCKNSTTAMECIQSKPVPESCSPVTCQGLNCTVGEDKSGCPICSCKAPCPIPVCQEGCRLEKEVSQPGRCPGCACKLSRSARDNTGKECPPPTCLGYNCSVITAENGCQKCLCESPCEDAPQCPSHCKLETNVPEGRCRGCVCSYGETTDNKRGGGKVPDEPDSEIEPEKREDLEADFIPLPGKDIVPGVDKIFLIHGDDDQDQYAGMPGYHYDGGHAYPVFGEPLESGLYNLDDHVLEESESRLPEEAREEVDDEVPGEDRNEVAEYHHEEEDGNSYVPDFAEEKTIADDEDDKCAQKNCPDGQKCVIRRLQCIRTPCPAIPVCIEVEPRCPIPMCAIGCMVMKWDDEVCPSCFCGIIRGAEGRVCPRTRCLGKRCYNVIGDDGCPQCKCDSICIPPKCYDGCFVEKDPPAGKCPTCTCPDRGSVVQPIIPGTTPAYNASGPITEPGSETLEDTNEGTTVEVVVTPYEAQVDDLQGRNPIAAANGGTSVERPNLLEHDGVDFYNSLAEIEEQVKSGELTTVTVNLPTTIDAADIFDTSTAVPQGEFHTETDQTVPPIGTTISEDSSSQETSTVALNMLSDEIPTTKKPCLLKPNASESTDEAEPSEHESITEKDAGGSDNNNEPMINLSETESPSVSSTRKPQKRPTAQGVNTKVKPKPQVVGQSDPPSQPQVFQPFEGTPDQDDTMKPILQNLQHLISNLHHVLSGHQRPANLDETLNPSLPTQFQSGNKPKPSSAEDLQQSDSVKIQQDSTELTDKNSQQNQTVSQDATSTSQINQNVQDTLHATPNQQVLPHLLQQGMNPQFQMYPQYPYPNPQANLQALGLMQPQVPFQNHLQSIYAGAAQNPLFSTQQQAYYPSVQQAFLPNLGTFQSEQYGQAPSQIHKQHVLLTNIPIPPSLQQQLMAGTQTLGFLQHLLNHRNNPFYQQQLLQMQQQLSLSPLPTESSEEKDNVNQTDASDSSQVASDLQQNQSSQHQYVFSSHQPLSPQQHFENGEIVGQHIVQQLSSGQDNAQQSEQRPTNQFLEQQDSNASISLQAMPEFPLPLTNIESASDINSSPSSQSPPIPDIQFNHHAPQSQQQTVIHNSNQSPSSENVQQQQQSLHISAQQQQLDALSQQYQQLQQQMNQVQFSQQGYFANDNNSNSQEKPLEQDQKLEQPILNVQFTQEQHNPQINTEENVPNQEQYISPIQADEINFSSQQHQMGQIHSDSVPVYDKPIPEQVQNNFEYKSSSENPVSQTQTNYQAVISNHNVPQIQSSQHPQMQQNVATVDDPVLFESQGQTYFNSNISQEHTPTFQQSHVQQAQAQYINQQGPSLTQDLSEHQYQVSQVKPEQFPENAQSVNSNIDQLVQQTFQSQSGITTSQQQFIPFERPVYQQQSVNTPNVLPYQPLTSSDPSNGIGIPSNNQQEFNQQQAFLNQNNLNQQQNYNPFANAQVIPIAEIPVQDTDPNALPQIVPSNIYVNHQQSQVQYVNNDNELTNPIVSAVLPSVANQVQQQHTIYQYKPIPEQQNLQQQYVPSLQQPPVGTQQFTQQGDVSNISVQNKPLVQQQQYLGSVNPPLTAQQRPQVFENPTVQNQQYQQQYINSGVPAPLQTQAQFQQQQFISNEKPIVQVYQPQQQQPQQDQQQIPQQFQQPNYNQQQFLNQQQHYNQQQHFNQQQYLNQQQYYNPHHHYNQQQQQYIQQQYFNPNQGPLVEAQIPQQQFNSHEAPILQMNQQQTQQFVNPNQAPSTYQQYQQQFISNHPPQIQMPQMHQQQNLNDNSQAQPTQVYLIPQASNDDPSLFNEGNEAQQDSFDDEVTAPEPNDDSNDTNQEQDSLQQHIEDQVVVEPHFGEENSEDGQMDDPNQEEPIQEHILNSDDTSFSDQQDDYQEHIDDKFSALKPLAQVVTGEATPAPPIQNEETISVLASAPVQQVIEDLKHNASDEHSSETVVQESVPPFQEEPHSSYGVKTRPGVIYRPHFSTASAETSSVTPEMNHDLFPAPSRPLSNKPTVQQEDWVDQQFVQEDAPQEHEEFDYDEFELTESTTLSSPLYLSDNTRTSPQPSQQEILENFDNHQPDSMKKPINQQELVDDPDTTTSKKYFLTRTSPSLPTVSPTAEAYSASKYTTKTPQVSPYQCPTPHCNGYNCSLIRGPDGCQKCVCDSPCAPCPQHCVKTKTVSEGRCSVCDCTGAPPLALASPTQQCPVIDCKGSNCRKVKDNDGCQTCICDPKCVEPQCDPGCEILRDVPPGQCPGCVCRVTVVQAVVQRQRPCKPVTCGKNCNKTKGPDGCPNCVCNGPCPAPKCDPGCRIQSDVAAGQCPTCVCSSTYADEDDDDDDDFYCPNLFCSEYGCREIPGPAGCPICMCDPVCQTPVCDPGCQVVSNKHHGRCPVCVCRNPVNGSHLYDTSPTSQKVVEGLKTVQQQPEQHPEQSPVTFSGMVEAVVAEEEEEEEEESTASTLHTTVTVQLETETTTEAPAPTCPSPVCSGLRCGMEKDENGCEVCKCRYKCPQPKCVGNCYPEVNAPSHRCAGCVCPQKPKPPKY